MKKKLMMICCVAALLGVAQEALGWRPLYPDVLAKRSDPTKWTYPDWSEGFPKLPKEETKATIETRAKSADYLGLLERTWATCVFPGENLF